MSRLRRRLLPLLAVGVAAVVIASLLAVLVTRGSGEQGLPEQEGEAPPPSGSGSTAPDETEPELEPSGPPALAPVGWQQASAAFLDTYVDPDGRVVRRDQGDDTVSEGQAYAMLVAVALGDEERFGLVWEWTQDNLVRVQDGLLAWRWADGAVADAESASDADLDAARALVLAGEAFDDEQLTADGIALGQAVLDHETVELETGRVMVAGTWALTEPYAYNPSYASPAATVVLAEADPDPRWAQLDAGTQALSTTILDQVDLPPDWGQVDASGETFNPMPGAAGRGNEGVRYGYDAFRLPLRYAESCDATDVDLAARLVEPLERFDGTAAVLDLGGQPLVEGDSVFGTVAHAGALAAAGDLEQAGELLQLAAEIDAVQPSYFGSAWVALAPIMLTTDELGGCAPLAR